MPPASLQCRAAANRFHVPAILYAHGRSPGSLPIEAALPRCATRSRDAGAAVLQAPPGAGKTTRVPLALLDEPWLGGRRIVMLEPRRLAARAAARRMAETLGEEAGGAGRAIASATRRGSARAPGSRSSPKAS